MVLQFVGNLHHASKTSHSTFPMRLCYGLMRRIFHPSWLLTLVVGIGLTGCAGLQDPAGLAWDPGATPDYTSNSAWVSLPDREDESDAVPKNLPEAERTMDSLDVDVFFVHPTQFFRGEHWNAHMDNRKVNALNAKYPMRLQASAFNIGGRLYAPTYRQAHIGVFTWQDSTSWKALELAYEDVKAAFQHYLDHWNNGRPIILAGHSQGSWHIRWLLQEFFDGKPLQDQLVVAYAPGFDFYATDFEHVPYCANADETGCVCAWMSYGEGYFPNWLEANGKTPMCTHPITWKLEGTNSIEDHQGVVLSQMRYAYPEAVVAHVERGVLQVHKPDVPFAGLLHRENWHVGDINLFWLNIRNNAKQRTLNHRQKSIHK